MDDADVHALLIRLREFSHVLHERARREAPEGFGMQHLLLMRTLFTVGPQKQSDLATVLGISKGAVSQALTSLEEGGFVQRRRDERDARVQWAHVTPKADEFRRQMEGRMSRLFHDVFEGWSQEDTRRMAEMLDGLIERTRSA